LPLLLCEIAMWHEETFSKFSTKKINKIVNISLICLPSAAADPLVTSDNFFELLENIDCHNDRDVALILASVFPLRPAEVEEYLSNKVLNDYNFRKPG
jgi:hypothetical protein